MMDWQKASAELSKKLDPAHVKPPAKFGPKGFYIEGWHAIAEANRIFGFDGWSYSIVDLKCVAERDRPIGQDRKPGFGVTYTAHVRVDVAGVIRDDVGAGHGYDVDLGLAHESAIKEAVTDCLKRCLRTFGNPFGLALYDKSRENVGREEPEDQAPPLSQRAAAKAPDDRAQKAASWALKAIASVDDVDAFDALTQSKTYKKAKEVMASRPELMGSVMAAAAKRFDVLSGPRIPLPGELAAYDEAMADAGSGASLPEAFHG